jgi:pSer/pThr/pTyr-binding forkhead associated (FHA) protein
MPDNTNSNSLQSAKLVWQNDNGAIQELVINDNATTSIGREPSNDIELPNKKVSKQHALIFWKEHGFIIADQGSTNGTLLNGSRIMEQKTLKDGDRIEIGDFVLSFYFLGEKPIEEFKTRLLSKIEVEGAGKTTRGPNPPTEKLADIEELPTMINPSDAVELSLTRELPPNQAEQKEATPLEVIPMAEAQPKAKETIMLEQPKAFASLDLAFDELLAKQTQITRATAQTLKEKGQATQTHVLALVSQLATITREISDFEQQTTGSKLAEILDKLTGNPNDVTLLVELASHSDLIRRLIKDYSRHAATLNKIKEKLEIELTDFTR